MDIKELALKVAKEMNWRMDEMTLETFATRLIATLEQRVAELENVISEHGADMWAQGEEYAALSAKCAQAQIKADALEQQVAALTKERDEKVLLNNQLADHLGETEDQLAAAQARESKLREALALIYNGSTPAKVIARFALKAHTDDSALMERLAQERERCAEVAEDTAAGRDAEAIAEAIRRMT